MTLAELQALPNEQLDAMAARLMGWAEFVSGLNPRGDKTPYHWQRPDGTTIRKSAWHPTTDRNQSGECLAQMVARGAEFKTHHWKALEPSIHWRLDRPEWERVPGNDARAEIIACLLAHFALEGES